MDLSYIIDSAADRIAPLTLSGDHAGIETHKEYDLHIDRKYCLNLNGSHGIRELIQNCYDGAKNTALDLECNKLMVEEKSTNLFKMYSSKGKSEKYLLAAIHIKQDEIFLVNFGVNLNPQQITVLGRSSKQESVDLERYKDTEIEGQVGKFGEGAIVGILSLLREGSSVQYWTSNSYWKFSFSDQADGSLIHFKQCESDQAVQDVLVVKIGNVKPNRFNVENFLFLSRLSRQYWRLIPAGQENWLSGVEILPLHNVTGDAPIYNRSLLLGRQDLPFAVNILDNIQSLERDRNSAGLGSYSLIRLYILPRLHLLPLKDLIEYLLPILEYSQRNNVKLPNHVQPVQISTFQSNIARCFHDSSISKMEKKFGHRVYQALAQRAKDDAFGDVEMDAESNEDAFGVNMKFIPIDERYEQTEIRKMKDAGLDPKNFVLVNDCLMAIFQACGYIEKLKVAARKVKKALFEAKEMKIPSENKDQIQDLIQHASAFAKLDIQVMIHNVANCDLPSAVFKRLGNSALVRFEYHRSTKELHILSSCLEQKRLHAVSQSLFTSSQESRVIRKVNCMASGACRCLLNAVLDSIADQHYWSAIDIVRYWAEQSEMKRTATPSRSKRQKKNRHEVEEEETEDENEIELKHKSSTNKNAPENVLFPERNNIQETIQQSECSSTPQMDLVRMNPSTDFIPLYVDRKEKCQTIGLASTFEVMLIRMFKHVVQVPHTNVRMFRAPNTQNWIACNADGILWFNLGVFEMQAIQKMSLVERAYYWFDAVCHELTHNQYEGHDNIFRTALKQMITSHIARFFQVFVK